MKFRKACRRHGLSDTSGRFVRDVEFQSLCKFGEVCVQHFVRLVENDVSAFSRSYPSENENVFDVVEQRIVCDGVTEIYADRFVDLSGSLIAVRVKFLYDFELFRRGKIGIEFYSRRGRDEPRR